MIVPAWNSRECIAHAVCMARSYRELTGHELVPGPEDAGELARRLFEAPFVLASHGTEPDPILNYGNAKALEIWAMPWDEFTRTPSRFTAEEPNRAERARLLEQVTGRGFIENYSGIRISRTGRRFLIENATVWNLRAEDGAPCGQAARFSDWTWL